MESREQVLVGRGKDLGLPDILDRLEQRQGLVDCPL
jgi:hypothetical protein